MINSITFDEREIKEIQHALYQANVLHHGTVGHNVLMLLAKTATELGFYINETNDLYYGDTLATIAFNL